MRKRLGCLHAHHSNISYIDSAFKPYDLETVHFVDPALYFRIAHDEHFLPSDAFAKVKEQVSWMAKCELDAILVTCTNYIAVLQDETCTGSIPILKIDEPYFEVLCQLTSPQIVVFTNPDTVAGTVKRLKEHATRQGRALELEVRVLEGTFPLIMQGKTEEYLLEVAFGLERLLNDISGKNVSVAQLSMVEAALQVQQKTSQEIVNPLTSLVASIVDRLELVNIQQG